MLKISAIPSIDALPPSGMRCCMRRSTRRRGGWVNALRGTIVPFGRRRALPLAPSPRRAPTDAHEHQAAHLEAAADLPDAVEDSAVPLVGGGVGELVAEIRRDRER